MTGNKEIFVKIDAYTTLQVKMGNGAFVQANGRGTIAIETKKGRRFIEEVLLVPDLD